MGVKFCKQCKQAKPFCEYYLFKGLPCGNCKSCQKEYHSRKSLEKLVVKKIDNLIETIDGVVYKEEWLPIVGFEGLYEISNFGRVKSLARKYIQQDYLMKIQNSCYGYIMVTLTDFDGNLWIKCIHILVARHFIPNPKNKPEVNHIKGAKKDSRFHQLEWVTKKENMRHAYLNGLCSHKGEKNSNHSLANKDVLYIFNSKKSRKNLAEIFGVSTGVINSIKSGKRWGHLTGKIHNKREMLSEELVKNILSSGLGATAASKVFGVPSCRISQLKNRKAYSHLF